MKKMILAGVIGLLTAFSAGAAEVKVTGAWARATAPGQDSASIQCVLNSGKEARVIAVSSPAASSAELHRMMQMNGMMMMHAVKALPLTANKPLDLAAEGYHLMLLGLKQPLKAGDSVAFSLTIEFADKHREQIDASADIKPLTAAAEGHEHHHHH